MINTYPSPEEDYIRQDEIEELLMKAQKQLSTLIKLTFHRLEIYEAWYAREIERVPVKYIATAQKISPYKVRKRINTAKDIILNMRRKFKKIDDC
jgi:hypothetical protein